MRKQDETTGLATDEPFKFDVSEDMNYNQQRYEALGELITERIYRLLTDIGLHKIYVPETVDSTEASFVFASKPDISKSKKLMLLIHGSGVVRAGQWSRSLIINHSLDHGTQIPYIKRAIELGYDVIVTNTNHNDRINSNGRRVSIVGSESPTKHGETVWTSTLKSLVDVESFAVVAHSYGGIVTVDLASKYPDVFREKCFAVGFTDSVHSVRNMSPELRQRFRKIAVNWVTSTAKLDTELETSSGDIPLRSAGHTKHEWTSWACIDALFKFLEENYTRFQRDEL